VSQINDGGDDLPTEPLPDLVVKTSFASSLTLITALTFPSKGHLVHRLLDSVPNLRANRHLAPSVLDLPLGCSSST
jgi:hypothetical protein